MNSKDEEVDGMEWTIKNWCRVFLWDINLEVWFITENDPQIWT